MATDLTQEFCALRDTYIEKQFGRLNDMQRQAVFTTDGPLLILAGAGSGKTTVLVNRIANLIRFGSAHGSKQTPRPATEDDIKALRNAIMTGTAAPSWLDGMLRQNTVRSWNVMAITFTNKAAGELKERLRRMLGGEEGDEVFASTFHSACVHILRRWAEEIAYPRSFTIYDTDDSQRVMKAVYKDLNVDDKFLPIKAAINQMSRWKDQLVSPEQALASPAKDTKGALTARIYAAYEKRLKEAGAFDFDDLIYQTVQLLAEHKDVRDFYQNKYRYLLVDEYQDTSVAQFRLVSLLTGPEKNICVVGDDDQSIYRFRGATIENILNFERIYPGTKTIRLEQNYRSTSNILNAANCVIQHNTERKGKTLWTSNGEGDKVQVYTAENEQDEASHIADVIGQHLKEGGHLADHAILYRMNAQSAPIESYFTRAGIPHKIVGGQRFNDRKGFPESYDMALLSNFLRDVLSGKSDIVYPLYSQELSDIVPGKYGHVKNPDVLIIEGINTLQLPESGQVVTSDFFDFSIYIDAEEDLIEKWYMQRFRKVLKLNKNKPDNFYYKMANGPLEDAIQLAEETWQMVNLVNLREYIAPTKERASLILHKTDGHLIDRIYLRHI